MTHNSAYTLTFHVMRRGTSYEIHKKNIRSSATIFLPVASTFRFTIGSADSDYIQMRDLASQHAVAYIADDYLTLLANQPFRIMADKLNRVISLKQEVRFHIDELDRPHRMYFLEDNMVVIKVTAEEETLDNRAHNFLESQYGPVKKIQQGKAALIYRTNDQRILKVLRPSYARHSGALKRFRQSAKKLLELDPAELGIAKIGGDTDHALHYLEMKYFAGETLENILGRIGTLPLDVAIEIVRNIAQSLSLFQQCGYACRNLTPSNIIVCDAGGIKITSSFLTKTDDELTMATSQMVIPAYTAPEQIEEAASGNILSDMFSLGVIFYSMLIGEVPYPAVRVTEYTKVLSMMQAFDREKITNIAPNIPQDICDIIVNLLSFNSQKRPDPEALLCLLDKAEGGNAASESVIESDPFSGEVMHKLDKFEMADEVDAEVPSQKTKTSPPLPNIMEPAAKPAPEQYHEMTEVVADEPPKITFPQKMEQAPNKPLPSLDITQIDEHPFEKANGKKSNTDNIYSITVIEGDSDNQHYKFRGDRIVKIGRSGDFIITRDPKISRDHVHLQVSNGVCRMTEMPGRNGVFIDGERIEQPRLIESGTHFVIGNTTLCFTIINPMNADLTQGDLPPLEELSLGDDLNTASAFDKVGFIDDDADQDRPILEESNKSLKKAYEQFAETHSYTQTEVIDKLKSSRFNAQSSQLVWKIVVTCVALGFLVWMGIDFYRSNFAVATSSTSKELPSAVDNTCKVIQGEVVKIDHYQGQEDYLIIYSDKQDKFHAVFLSEHLFAKCSTLLEMAKKIQIPVKVTGQQQLLKSQILINNQEIRQCLSARQIEIGNKVFREEEFLSNPQ